MKTKWNIDRFYKSIDDPKIEQDNRKVEESVQLFINKYKGADEYLKNPKDLLKALEDFESLVEIVDVPKPFLYFSLKNNLNSSDSKVEAKLNKLVQFYTKLENDILFFTLNIGKIPVSKQKIFLEEDCLKHYHYFLKTTFDEAKHNLSEKEERIMNLKYLPSKSLWVKGGERLVNKQTVTFQRKELPLPEALNKIPTLDPKNRRRLHERVMSVLKSISDYSENEINAIVLNKKIDDDLRGFTKPFNSRFLSDEVTEKEVMVMINAVTKNFKISHQFYKIKNKLLHLRKPQYSDRSAEFEKLNKNFNIKESTNFLREIYTELGDRYVEIFDRFLTDGNIDFKPQKGKSGGAFCWGTIGNPTFVLLNHIDDYNSYKTFSHEMGHAFHSELSKAQTPLYHYYSSAAAETASTLFEELAFEKISEKVDEKSKKILLHNKLDNEMSTIFRQVAAFNFEVELHNEIRKEGFLPKEEISKLMNKHMKSYLGPTFNLSEDDGYFFVTWSHIRRFFYVYTYAYGQLISKILFYRYKKDKSYWNEIEKFLSAGGSKSTHDIFAEIGIDTYDEKFWLEGLKGIQKEIDDFQKLLKQ